MVNKKMKYSNQNKKGWIRIVEAFVAVLLLTGVILIVLSQEYIERTDISGKVYDDQLAILRDIQNNDSLRADILSLEDTQLPTALINKIPDSNFPQKVADKIIQKTPGYLDCDAKICGISADCLLENPPETDIYTLSVAIVANLEVNNPRKLVLFCFTK